MPRTIVPLLAIGIAVWVPIAVAWGQVPSVGPRRDAGVSCLCPGQPIRNYPTGANCAAICQPTLPPAPAVGLLDLRRAAFLAEKAQDATPEQAATLVDEALKIADRAAPFVEIDDPGCRHSMVAARSPFACHDMALYQRLTSGR